MELPSLLYWEKLARDSHPGVLHKKGFLKFSQNSQKNTGVGVFFNKAEGLRPAPLSKRKAPPQVFPYKFGEIF